MTVEMELDRIDDTRTAFMVAAVDLMEDTADYAQQVAISNARNREGALAGGIRVEPSQGGLNQTVESTARHSVFNEYGTGIYAEGTSRAQNIPWVYFDEYLGQFFTTYGLEPQPFMRPAYEEAKTFLKTNAPRYFG